MFKLNFKFYPIICFSIDFHRKLTEFSNYIIFTVEGTHKAALAWLNAPMPANSLEQLLETGREALISSRPGDLANGVMDPSLTPEQSKSMLISVSSNFP